MILGLGGIVPGRTKTFTQGLQFDGSEYGGNNLVMQIADTLSSMGEDGKKRRLLGVNLPPWNHSDRRKGIGDLH